MEWHGIECTCALMMQMIDGCLAMGDRTLKRLSEFQVGFEHMTSVRPVRHSNHWTMVQELHAHVHSMIFAPVDDLHLQFGSPNLGKKIEATTF